MPTYFYTAKSLKGEPKAGERIAKTQHELAAFLRGEGYILISATPQEQKTKKGMAYLLSLFQRVSLTDRMFFTRNLQVMVAAGISLPRALRTLAGQSKNKKFKKVLESIAEDISKGDSFSQGLSRHPKIFSELFLNMVKVGEETGGLELVLANLTKQMEREHNLRAKVKGAMVYPAVIVIAMLGIGVMMLILVVPKLSETFEELKIELPPTTKFVIFVGNFLADFWYLIPVLLLALFIIGRLLLMTRVGKKTIHFLLLKIPIISPILRKTNSAYTTRTLSSLIRSGVPLVRSLEIISGTLTNIYFKQAIRQAALKVRKGENLAQALRPYQNIYPSLVIEMLQVGEETGQTSEILEKLAEFFEEEVDNATKNLASVVEPVLMIIIGAAVGFFAVSMIQPMYSMLGTL